MMLPFFPAGFPGELFASRVSQYHLLSGNSTVLTTFKELFQSGLFSLTHWAPKKLDRLAERIAGDKQAIVFGFYRDSTLLPLFRLFAGLPFCIEDRAIPAGTGEHMPRRIVGESGSTFVCTKCLAEDAEEYGAPFIHCTHQTPGVTSCWRHRIQLIDRCPSCRCPIEPPKGLILSPWLGCPCGQKFQKSSESSLPRSTEVEVSLARFAKALFDYSQSHDRPINLAELYRQRALELGFCRGKRVDRAALLSALEDYFSEGLLAKVDRAYRQGRTDSWLYTLSRRSFSESPITRHLILSNYLFREPEAFISQLSAKAASKKVGQRLQRYQRREEAEAACDSGASVESQFNKLLGRLVGKARQHRLSVDDLWKTDYASMKKLVKLRPEATLLVERWGAKLDGPSYSKSSCRVSRVSAKDKEWADAIKVAANRVYADPAKPLRITMNILLNRTSIRPAKWLDPGVFPQARAVCEALAESRWHFYARRLIWAMNEHSGGKIGRSVISRAAGLENARATDLWAYFHNIGFAPTGEAAIVQLERLGIMKHWGGPYPDRVYKNVGRNYVPRKSRQSNESEGPRETVSDLGFDDA